MKSIELSLGMLVAGCCLAIPVDQADSAIKGAQKRELSRIRKDVSRASSLIRRKKLDEAEKILQEAGKRFEELAKAAGLKPSDKLLAPTKTAIARQQKLLKLRKRGKKGSPKNSDIPTTAKKKTMSVVIAKATGNEKVSFVKDIAPTFVNICTRCHGENNLRAEFSLVTFELLMKGGQSGRVLIAGDVKGSRLFRLVGGLELPRMPQGPARITRKFYNDLQTWINEGLKYDGGDPKKRLRDIVPTEEEMKAERIAEFSPKEFSQFREDQTAEQWQRVLRNEPARLVRGKEFFVYGNVSVERLQKISEWSEDHAKLLRSMFNVNSDLIWKGRLTVFVYKDRFGYTEFNHVIHYRDTPMEVTGHSVVTPSIEDAYVVLQDVGDKVDAASPGLRINVIDHLTGAFLKRSDHPMPEWIARGTGLALAAQNFSGNMYVQGLRGVAIEALRGLEKPEDVFTNGQFSPTQIGPVGYSLVDFILKTGGAPKFVRFIGSLQSGSNVAAAVKTAYPRTNLKALGTAYFRSLLKKRK